MTPRIALATAPFHPDIQAVLDRVPREWMPPFHLFTALARDRRVFQRFTRGGMIDLHNGHLSLRQREVLLDRVLARTGCEYEWGLRIHFFAEGGELSPEQIYSTVHGGPDDGCWDDEDRSLLRLADALHDQCDIGDARWADLRNRFSEEAILELLYLAGYYRSVGCIANALRLPLEKIGISFPPLKRSEAAMPQIDFLTPPALPPTMGYSHCVTLSGGSLIFISGQVARDASGALVGKDDFAAQLEQVFRNLKIAVEAAGGSMTGLLKLNYYCADTVDPARLSAVPEIRDRYVNAASPPASTFVVVRRLVRPEWLIEIEAVAAIGDPE